MRFLGGEAWQQALAGRVQALPLDLRRFDPGRATAARLRRRKAPYALIRDDRLDPRGVQPSGALRLRASLSPVLAWLDVKDAGARDGAMLIVGLKDSAWTATAKGTARLFRWNERTKRLSLVRLSATGEDASYVWAWLNQPGRYAVIGLPTNPRLLAVLEQLRSGLPLLSNAGEIARQTFKNDICQYILCAPGAIGRTTRGGSLQKLNEDLVRGRWPAPPDGGGNVGGDPCALCMRFGFDAGLPELQILDDIDRLPVPWFTNTPLATQWTELGPTYVGGVSMDVSVDPADSRKVYALAQFGGLWRLDWNATYTQYTWTPLTDYAPTLAGSAVAIAPSNPGTIYYYDARGVIRYTTNGGATWKECPAFIDPVSRLEVHPTDPNDLYIATTTGLWRWQVGQNPTRLQTGDITDVALDPDDPGIIYAASRGIGVQRFGPAGTGAAWATVFSRTDAQALSVGIYSGETLKLAVGRQGTPATRTVAVKIGPRPVDGQGNPTMASFSEVFVSRSAGIAGSWSRCTPMPVTSFYNAGDWVNVIAVDPHDDNVMLVGTQYLLRTEDGGTSWMIVLLPNYVDSQHHEDQHRVSFDKSRPGVAYVANDGGIYESRDHGARWQAINNGYRTLPTFYGGAHQHSGMMNINHWGVWGNADFASLGWGMFEGPAWEFNPVRSDPHRPDVFFIYQTGLVRHVLDPTGATDRSIWTTFQTGTFAFSPDPSLDVAIAAEVNTGATPTSALRRTLNASATAPTWTRELVTDAAGASVLEIAGAYFMGTVFSPARPRAAYAIEGASRTVFFKNDVTTATAWVRRGTVTGDVLGLAASPANVDTVFVLTTGALLRSIDGGTTFTGMVTPMSAPPTGTFRQLCCSPSDGWLYLRTDVGLFVSPNDGSSWFGFNERLPNAQIYDIWLGGDYLYATLYGRGLWRRQISGFTAAGP